MWLITKGATRDFYPTCAEKQLLTSPSYIVKFVHSSNKQERFCVCTDSSSYPDRFQKFTIVETSNPTNKTNQVKLNEQGLWYWYVYEISSTDLAAISDLTTVDYDTLTEVEQGEALVSGSTTTPASFTYSQSTYKQYGN